MTTSQLFNAGNYAAVALTGDDGSWEYFAALGLIGKGKEALDGLSRFSSNEARFYSGVAAWIDGDDPSATAFLRGLNLPHAKALLALLEKPKINVLAQIPSLTNLPNNLLERLKDSRFNVRNIGLGREDVTITPYDDIRRFCVGFSPDFFICREIEWMALPTNLHELRCPVFGHTEDYDIHLQAIYPWFQLFDEIITCGSYEWNDLTRIQSVPVSTFPKAYGIPQGTPAFQKVERSIDLFLSGTILHPYHPDKAKFLFDLLGIRDEQLEIKFVTKFLRIEYYFEVLNKVKMSVPYVRFDGSMPTRGLEALSMGCALALQKGSILGAFVGEDEGVYTYEEGGLNDLVSKISRNWGSIESKAAKGAERVRREFSMERVSSQYFRYLTFLAAKPRKIRRPQPVKPLIQKRVIFYLGWALPPTFYSEMLNQTLAKFRNTPSLFESPHFLNDLAHDTLLRYAQSVEPAAREATIRRGGKAEVVPELFAEAIKLFEVAVDNFPRNLVPQFNLFRALLHFGSPEQKSAALNLGSKILAQPFSHWEIEIFEDVFSWDYFPDTFNYRRYLDHGVEILKTGKRSSEELIRLITASINHYLSIHMEDVQFSRNAAALDPGLPYYQLRLAVMLSRSPSYMNEGIDLLIQLTLSSIIRLEAWKELQKLEKDGHVGSESLIPVEREMKRILGRIR